MQAFSCRKEAEKEIQRVVIVQYNHRSISIVSEERRHSRIEDWLKEKQRKLIKHENGSRV